MSVALETEDPLDDIRINFQSGWTALVQAKRALTKGAAFSKAVDQWIKAAQSSLAPEAYRFVIVSGSLSGPLRDLQKALERHRSDLPGPPTKGESEALSYLDELLSVLTLEQKEKVLRCGVLCELAVEELHHSDARVGALYLRPLVSPATAENGRKAWKELVSAAGKTARLRGGYLLGGWLAELRGAGVAVATSGEFPSAELERLHGALERYKERVIRAAASIDLRSLGARLPSIPFEEIDADVKVTTDPEDTKAEADLLWAFLRRGRLILTGLPGGGKSTAIRNLAAQLCTLPGAPLPLRVSLREVDALEHTASFRDRLLTAAVRDDAPADRALIRRELDARLSSGGVALLLDSLDETYDRRAAVASEIDDFMKSVSSDVDALLSTRDVAFGHAATLGWEDLSLLPPKETDRVIRAILSRAAENQSVSTSDADRWVQERIDWVNKALRRDATLRETPLLPILLTLLAAEKELDTLPLGRARVLAEVVHDAVSRHELTRQDGSILGPLEGSATDTAAMHAFAVEASAILKANGSIKLGELERIVAGEIAVHWGLSPGFALATARDAIQFFDGSGIFVITGSTETVAPRVALFAEIGDALRATEQPEKISEWVSDRIQSAQIEPLILAAGISTTAAEALGAAASESGERGVLHAAVRAYREGATISEGHLESICNQLIIDLSTADTSSWDSWTQLLHLPITPEMRTAIEAAVVNYDQQRQKLVRAELDLRFRSRDDLRKKPESLLDLLRLENLPYMVKPVTSGKVNLRAFLVENQLHAAQIAAAEILTGLVPEATELVVERAKHGPPSLRTELRDILIRADLQAAADETEEPRPDFRMPDWLRDFEPDNDRKFLNLLAQRPKAELTYQQQARCDELADLLETLSLNDASSLHMFKYPEDIPGLIDLTETLFAFDAAVVAAQARLTLDRMDKVGGSDAYYALFDKATGRRRHHWDKVSNVADAIALLSKMITWGRAHAWYVAAALWDAPVAEPAALMLREKLPLLASSCEHLRIGALTLCSLVTGPEPESWCDSQDPVLRGVAAELCESSENGHLSSQHYRFLEDPDGHVRLTALNRAAKLHPPDIGAVLEQMGNQPPTAWICRSCRTVNPPNSTSCNKAGCFRSGPNITGRLQELIDRT
ncbi:hypothetical protein ACIP9X_18985 [Arthrobacter sp. NPDC093125]|uniref:hypothetical protein n=1 Tax=Arthrobacter sp. NPDC093125 TaxID=3363944 RepID=UPI00382E1242